MGDVRELDGFDYYPDMRSAVVGLDGPTGAIRLVVYGQQERAPRVKRVAERTISFSPRTDRAAVAHDAGYVLAGHHAIGKVACRMETSAAARPFYRGSDHRRVA